MKIFEVKKIGWLIAFISLSFMVTAQQYSVTGGAKAPLLAEENKSNRISVYLVYGMVNVQISYTSSSTSHQWYRYKTSALESEQVLSTQLGTTSFVANVEEGYGYYVKESEAIAMNNFIWIVDYSKYESEIRGINALSNMDPCMAIRFEVNADIKDMVYYLPNGTVSMLKREFELSYETLIWNDALKQFSRLSVDTIITDPFAMSFSPPPLIDTEILLSGDMYARYFGIEMSASIPHYESKAVDVRADTMILSSGSSNVSGGPEGELYAPVTINFIAYANIPTASRFAWRIYTGENMDQMLKQQMSEEMEHTFNMEGRYLVKLEVNDNTGTCFDEENTFEINITNTIMEIPNAFSPGCTPGINDVFRVQYKSIVNFRGWIFNRWGNELFQWINPEDGWDGKYRGKYVPPGAYYYLIEYTGTDGKKRTRKGNVNVFRTKEIDTEMSIIE